MPDPRVAHCVFCDDIRQETGNKISLMGLYVGELIIVGKPPVMLPKLGIVVWVIADVNDPIGRMTTTVHMPPDRKELAKFEASTVNVLASGMEDAKKMIAHQIMQIAPFMIEAPGMMEVMIDTDAGELRGGRLLIRFISPQEGEQFMIPSPTALPLPSEQSLPNIPGTTRRASRRRPSIRRTSRTPGPE
jgi:hypothetical protein